MERPGVKRVRVEWRERSRQDATWRTRTREFHMTDAEYYEMVCNPAVFLPRIAPEAMIVSQIKVEEVQGD